MRHGRSLLLGGLALSLVALLAVPSCGGDAETTRKPNGTGGSGGTAGSDASAGSGGAGTGGLNLDGSSGGDTGAADGCVGDACAADAGPACGDGVVDPGEKCDDANGVSGDGCAANCDAIEKDFACPTPGQPCVSTVQCGDSKISGNETCDDGNTNAADGCDASCQVESGWTCPNVGVKCVAALCGDGIVAGNEQCDDGAATTPGCDASCKLEVGYKCPTPGQACETTTCGDAKAEGTEQCDDGNNDMGDGCTPFCVKEPDCGAGACKSTCGDGLKLPSDNEQCEDGNAVSGDGCSSSCQIEPGYTCSDVASGTGNDLKLPIVLRDFKIAHPDMEAFLGVDLGIVAAQLKSNGKPKYANTGGTTPTTTTEANFDQWYTDVVGVNQTVLQTLTLTKLSSGVFQFSNGNFFPLNGLGWGNEGNSNNFHFTSEVRYWFEYKGSEVLDFTGDDDVWVFVNKQLAVDIGGVHAAMNGSVTLDAAKATQLGLQTGKVYEIVVFQAERHTTQSNYKLTLSGFTNTTSSCKSVCGDGIQTPDEACDDGKNDGTYGSCTSDCKKGPHCGDKTVQSPQEECDDGINLSPYGGCAPGCKNGGFCGDGVVDSLFGEACDDGVNDGGYGECAAGCTLGPRCGDGIKQVPQEECDDGNKQNGDGCTASCKTEGPA